MSITVLIVDDEPLARERVRMLLEEEKDVVVRAECAGAAEAKELLLRERIDMMFLDIQMPGMDGLQLVGIIPPERMPLVVFTTAYDEFAVKAFELDAADYLLKPFTKRRFQASLERVRQRLSSGDRDLFISRMLTTVNTIAQRLPYPEKIVVKSDGRICFLQPPEIRWIESEANYLRIHTVQAVHHVRETL
ncbi:MAG: response regulator, partial [Bacteroidetes bacterium]|nr:response regulator [Bacteroidota bacterium]